MRILITGGTGLLGYALQTRAPKHSISSIFHPNEQPLKHQLPFSTFPLDITNFASVSKFFNDLRPQVLIHTAAQGSVDWCEENKSEATLINVLSSLHLQQLCLEHQAHYVFISSNAVFQGDQGNYSETSPTNPVNHYGATKLAVEMQLSYAKQPVTILRPNLMFGWPYPGGRDNQVTRTISALSRREAISVVADTWFSPLDVNFMAEVIWHVVRHQITGLFNIGGPTRMSLYELSQSVADNLSLDPSLIKPKSVNDNPTAAPRAIDTSYDISLLKKVLGLSPPDIGTSVKQMQESVRTPLPL